MPCVPSECVVKRLAAQAALRGQGGSIENNSLKINFFENNNYFLKTICVKKFDQLENRTGIAHKQLSIAGNGPNAPLSGLSKSPRATFVQTHGQSGYLDQLACVETLMKVACLNALSNSAGGACAVCHAATH